MDSDFIIITCNNCRKKYKTRIPDKPKKYICKECNQFIIVDPNSIAKTQEQKIIESKPEFDSRHISEDKRPKLDNQKSNNYVYESKSEERHTFPDKTESEENTNKYILKDNIEIWYDTLFKRCKNSSESLRSKGWGLIILGVAMMSIGIFIIYGAISELEDTRFIEAMKYPIIYIITVWFAPSIVSLLAGQNALSISKTLSKLSIHINLMGTIIPYIFISYHGLAELLIDKNIATEKEIEIALYKNFPKELPLKLSDLELSIGEELSRKISTYINRKIDNTVGHRTYENT